METKQKLIIIDDDSRNIFALKAVLKAKGFDVDAATNAADGIQLLKDSGGAAIVLMDMMMPETDGYSAIRIIREDKEIANAIVISVTAQAMAGDKERCLAAGANDYISKPVDVDELIKTISKHL